MMSDEKANKIISEYMNQKFRIEFKSGSRNYVTENWCNSLDALIPVWEKLSGTSDYQMCLTGNGNFSLSTFIIDEGVSKSVFTLTIQQSAAYATAQAIQELKK